MENKKNNTSMIVLVCLVVGVLCCAGFLIFKQLTKNTTPKNIFINSIENLFKTEENEKDIETLKAEFSLDFNIDSVLLDSEVTDLINKLALSGKVDYDSKNKTSLVGFSGTYDKDTLLDAKFYANEEAMYIFLNDVFDKWIKLDTVETSVSAESVLKSNVEFDTEEVKAFVEEFKNVYTGALKDTYFTKEKEDDLNKVTLVIDNENILDIVNDVVDNASNNKKFKESFKKLFGIDLDTILEMYKPELKELTKEDFKDVPTIKFTVYADKDNNLKKFVVDTTIEEQPMKLEIETSDKDNASLTLYISGIKFVSLTVKTTRDKDYSNTKLTLSVTGMLDATINAKYKVVYNESVDAMLVTGSVDASKLTEADQNTITNKIMSNKGIQKIMTAIENMTAQDDLEYEY